MGGMNGTVTRLVEEQLECRVAPLSPADKECVSAGSHTSTDVYNTFLYHEHIVITDEDKTTRDRTEPQHCTLYTVQ